MSSLFDDSKTHASAIGNAIRALEADWGADSARDRLTDLHAALDAGLGALAGHLGVDRVTLDSGGGDKPPQ